MNHLTDLHVVFEARIPEIERLAGSHFRHLDPDAKDEAIQNSFVLAWRYHLNAARRGKHGCEDVFRSVVWWAIQHTKQGRQGGGRGQSRPKCVLDYARRRKAGVVLQGGINLNHFIGRAATIPDTVAFRLDVPAFLATLPERDRGIALSLSREAGTVEVARRYGVTPGASSQFRTRLRKRYDAFHGAV